jgi:hypothetical protein
MKLFLTAIAFIAFSIAGSGVAARIVSALAHGAEDTEEGS